MPVLWPFNGLAARIAGTLTLALVPIGVVAIFQAVQINRDELQRHQTELLTATAEAASGEALAIARASGATVTLAAHVTEDMGAHLECSRMFEAVVDTNPQFEFAAFVGTDGIVDCASSDVGRDVSQGPVFSRMTEERETLVVATPQGPISGASVIITATPVFLGGDFAGYVTVSVPHRRISNILRASREEMVSDIVTFNANGEQLSVNEKYGDISSILPMGRDLSSLVSNRQVAFRARTKSGEVRSFAMVPVMPGVLYALGSRKDSQVVWASASAVLFPALMLLAGLIVAFASVNRMVIRQIYQLKNHMMEFVRTRQVQSLAGGHRLARELAEIDGAWTELAERMRHDEAELENAVHDRDVLLKEVHHRVKNNLQLISSIINLKIRRATTPEALRMLSEVRSRVMSIASVHQSLYAAQSAGRMRADELLRTVVDVTIQASVSPERRIDISRDYDPVLLYPDQAVPFLLLATEAVTNALKYMGRNGDGLAHLRLRLEALDSGEARFSVVNTRGEAFHAEDQVRGSGLGRSLLAGFATQLNGQIEQEETETEYAVRLTFRPASFDLDERDHTMTDIDGEPAAPQS